MSIQTEIAYELKKKAKRDAAIASMKHVLSFPSGTSERWRAAYEHFLRQRPEARYEANYVASAVKERRTMIDKFGSTKHGRLTMSSPTWLLNVLRNTDPEYFIGKTAKQLSAAPHLRKMKKAFPEFFVPEII